MKVGDLVEDFALKDETGTERKLSEFLAQGPVVLFFYPAALTYGCTKESCHFRDLGPEFEQLGAQRIGISADDVEKQKRFSDKHAFDFPLLSDPDRKVAEMFGVKRGPIAITPVKRATFVIGKDARVLTVVHNEVSMNQHAERALQVLRSGG